VLALLEGAASLPASTSSQPEVACLLRLLQQHAGEHDVVAASCRLLLRLLGTAPATTLAALQEQLLLALLPRLLAQQQQREQLELHRQDDSVQQGLGHLQPAAALKAAASAVEDARCAALELLGAFMSTHVSLQRAAVAAWEPVAALFSLLLRPQAPSRRLALDNVSGAGWLVGWLAGARAGGRQRGREGLWSALSGRPACMPGQRACRSLPSLLYVPPPCSLLNPLSACTADPAADASARRL
jgi:hypothetical protein